MTGPRFALHDMGWHAFQQLCHTVLREILGQTVVSFLDNNDGGRDGAFTGRWSPTPATQIEGEFVVQCKHSSRIGHNIVRSELADELDKAERLAKAGRCDVYVLMTNAGVSGTSEERIAADLRKRGIGQVLILGSTWLDQTILESSRLRRLVPRLYGLGDLTQILDDRAYRQARAVLDAMRSDLAKLVLTGTYDRAAAALESHGFVLLLGAAATGKTTIAAQLALGAADDFDTAVVKLDTIADLQDRWNPDDRQLFWLDDAFGATQFDRSAARAWTVALPRVSGAIAAGGLFVLTSRDYVFRAARDHLKPGAFPLLNEAQVVVDVTDLRPEERSQILYNHLRHGPQPNEFLGRLTPNLELAASADGFTPELARRLSNPTFTTHVVPGDPSSVTAFFDHPSDFLRDVMSGLDTHARAALGLIFINHNWLPSPIRLAPRDRDLLERFGSTLGGVTDALAALSDGLVQSIIREGGIGWVFAHPTMVDAYADLLRTPELLHHLIAGFPLDVLFDELTCGDVGLEGAIVVPVINYDGVLDRLSEASLSSDPYEVVWRARRDRATFLSSRCDAEFLRRWIEQDPERLSRLARPGLMLEADAENELVARLNEFGLFPEELRAEFAEALVEYCISGEDPAVLWDHSLRSILTNSEQEQLRERVREELLDNLPSLVQTSVAGWPFSYPPDHPSSAVQPLRSLVDHLPVEFPGDSSVVEAAGRLEGLLDDWVSNQEWEDESEGEARGVGRASSGGGSTAASDRSVFEDLLDGR